MWDARSRVKYNTVGYACWPKRLKHMLLYYLCGCEVKSVSAEVEKLMRSYSWAKTLSKVRCIIGPEGQRVMCVLRVWSCCENVTSEV